MGAADRKRFATVEYVQMGIVALLAVGAAIAQDDQMLGNSNSDTLIGDDGVDSADGGPLSGNDGGIDRCDAETEVRCES